MRINNNKIVNLGLIIIGLIFISACSEDEIKQDAYLEIMPLKVGNSWTIKYSLYPEDDSVDANRKFETKVVRDTLINDKIYFLTETNHEISNRILINKENGFYSNNLENYENQDIFECKYPCKKGDSWTLKESDSFINEISTTVVKSINSKVTVPNGTHECILYENIKKRWIGEKDTMYHIYQSYLKPGVGPIKFTRYTKVNYDGELYLQSIDELVSFIIN